MRSIRGERRATHYDAHAAGLRGEVRRRLSGGVPAADDDHVLIAGTLGIARHRPVVHPGAAEAIDTGAERITRKLLDVIDVGYAAEVGAGRQQPEQAAA